MAWQQASQASPAMQQLQQAKTLRAIKSSGLNERSPISSIKSKQVAEIKQQTTRKQTKHRVSKEGRLECPL